MDSQGMRVQTHAGRAFFPGRGYLSKPRDKDTHFSWQDVALAKVAKSRASGDPSFSQFMCW